MPTYEGLRLKILKIRREKLSTIRRKKLQISSFTIISNNCWGGMIYESYNLVKQSPTIGMFFFPSDYIKFISNLKFYIESPLKQISLDESKWKTYLIDNNYNINCPIVKLNDVELFCLHYKSFDEVVDKWQRRCNRINWNKIIYKFNDQNGCTETDLKKFIQLPFENKIFFTCKDWIIKSNCIIKIRQFPKHDSIMASYEPFGKNRYLNIDELINNLGGEK